MRKETHYRVRRVGIFSFLLASGQQATHDWEITQLQYNGSNVEAIFEGIEYNGLDTNYNDQINFQIIDKDNIFGYGANTILDEFATGIYPLRGVVEVKEYQGVLVPGLYIRIIYSNNGAKDITFSCNLLRHINTETVP